MTDHTFWMRAALEQAHKALARDEVPVGAVIVYENEIIGRGHNLIESLQDPTAHAEMLAITGAANHLASWRLDDCLLYVTLEPCPMCMGAVLLSRISQVIYGAKDPRYGACGSAVGLSNHPNFDISTQITSGILEDECSALLKSFFADLRKRRKK